MTVRYSERYWNSVHEVFVVFDLETTGLDPKKDQIIEIGAVLFTKSDYKKTGEVDTFQCFIKPREPIPKEITKINGITNEMVADGNTEYEALTLFFDFITDRRLFAYNSKFDVAFIKETAKRCKYLLEDDIFTADDILPIVREAFKDKDIPNYRLSTVAKLTQFKPVQAHRAVADATMALHVYMAAIQYEYHKIWQDEVGDNDKKSSPKKIENKVVEKKIAIESHSNKDVSSNIDSIEKNRNPYTDKNDVELGKKEYLIFFIAILVFAVFYMGSSLSNTVKLSSNWVLVEESSNSKIYYYKDKFLNIKSIINGNLLISHEYSVKSEYSKKELKSLGIEFSYDCKNNIIKKLILTEYSKKDLQGNVLSINEIYNASEKSKSKEKNIDEFKYKNQIKSLCVKK